MAALLLLLLLCPNIHAEIMLSAGEGHLFLLDDDADFCSISRWTSEGMQVVWNSSDYYYDTDPLDVSQSGQYQQQCWTQGNLTLDRNTTLLVCDDQKMRRHEPLYVNGGETVELSCDDVGPNQTVQWAFASSRTDGIVFLDDGTSSVHQVQLLENKPSILVTLDRFSYYSNSYFCLEKQQLRCHLHSRFNVRVRPQFILRSVGESLELNCSDSRRNQTGGWIMFNSLDSDNVSYNSTLMFLSLTLAHTGKYTCHLGATARERYNLYVCPKPGPPAVELFTGGENLTLPCGDWNQTGRVEWLMRSNRTEGRVFDVESQQRDNMYPSGSSLVIRNVSLLDSGHFWCVAFRGPDNCVFRSETLVMFGEPGVDHHLLRSVLLSAVVLMMLCVVVVVGVWRGRRGEQLPAAVEELEMSQLSPESDAQEEAPV